MSHRAALSGCRAHSLRTSAFRGTAVNDLYRIDPKALEARRREAQETHVVTLQEDAVKPPPTVGTAPWQAILFGPALGQPSSEPRGSSPWVGWLLLGLAGAAALVWLVRMLLRGF